VCERERERKKSGGDTLLYFSQTKFLSTNKKYITLQLVLKNIIEEKR
jgi:hypothetical protein